MARKTYQATKNQSQDIDKWLEIFCNEVCEANKVIKSPDDNYEQMKQFSPPSDRFFFRSLLWMKEEPKDN